MYEHQAVLSPGDGLLLYVQNQMKRELLKSGFKHIFCSYFSYFDFLIAVFHAQTFCGFTILI